MSGHRFSSYMFIKYACFTMVVISLVFVLMQGNKLNLRFIENWNIETSNNHLPTAYIFFGTRPEIIKLAPLIIEMKKTDEFIVKTVFTGQHSDIVGKYLRLFDVNVDIWLSDTFKRGQKLNVLLGKILLKTEIIPSFENDLWIVQGDTSSALAVAMVAFHRNIRIAYVEAGLRTFHMYSPFPEEFNRKTISSISTYNFAPTSTNAKNLISEGISKDKIFITGNTVIDSARFLNENGLIKMPPSLKSVKSGQLILVTIHRRENLPRSNELYRYISLSKCSKCTFVVPVHPNPLAGESARNICKQDRRFICVPPLPYEELHWMLKHAKVVLTDSGGIQEEVTWYNTPVLILRNVTERTECITAGIGQIAEKNNIPMKVDEIMNKIQSRKRKYTFPFGDGTTSKKIVEILLKHNLSTKLDYIHPSSNVTFKTITYNENTNTDTKVKYIIKSLKSKSKYSIAVILQVYKRNTIIKQLESLISQSLKPKTIVIVQNGHYVNITGIIKQYRVKYTAIEFIHMASTKNLRFHGRFHIAYMLKEDYVSIWDDDMTANKSYLEYVVHYSSSHNFALMGANCRKLKELISSQGTVKVVQIAGVGMCDFVGHIWTLPRQFLIFYLSMTPLTLYTGEDIQLSFALQTQGIDSICPPMKGDNSASVIQNAYADSNSSFRTNQTPRTLLLCKLLLQNFKTIACKNCDNRSILTKCVSLFKAPALKAEKDAYAKDKNENIKEIVLI